MAIAFRQMGSRAGFTSSVGDSALVGSHSQSKLPSTVSVPLYWDDSLVNELCVGGTILDRDEAANQDGAVKRGTSYLVLATPYCVLVGALYQWSYWAQFHINIWPYVNVIDIIKLSAFPVVTGGIAVLVGAILGQFTFPNGYLPEGGGRDTYVGKFLRRYMDIIMIVLIVGGGIFTSLSKDPNRWTILSALIAMPTFVIVKNAGFLDGIFGDRVRSIIVYTMFVLPGVAVTQGESQAHLILTGHEYSYLADGKISDIDFSKYGNVGSHVKYIGAVNDYIFLLGGDNLTIFVMKMDVKQVLSLKYQSGS
jgi:hypothetical protein